LNNLVCSFNPVVSAIFIERIYNGSQILSKSTHPLVHAHLDTAGELVALTAQLLRHYAEVCFCGGWVRGRWPRTQPPQNRIHEPRSGESSQQGVRQRYYLVWKDPFIWPKSTIILAFIALFHPFFVNPMCKVFSPPPAAHPLEGICGLFAAGEQPADPL